MLAPTIASASGSRSGLLPSLIALTALPDQPAGSAPSSPSPPRRTPAIPRAGAGRDAESPSSGGTYASLPTIQSEVLRLMARAVGERLASAAVGSAQPGGGLGARDFALGAGFRAVAGAGQDLEVGDGVEGRGGAAVLGEVDDQAVEARRQAVVEDLRPGRRGVAAGGADPFGEDAVGARVARVVEGGADQAAVADRAVDRVLQLDRVDAVGDAVEAEADVPLAELRFAAELARRQLEVVDDRP